MKLYITFGQGYTHSHNGMTLDKNCVGVINCKDEAHGRELAFEWFDGVFATSYTKIDDSFMQHFPRGLVNLN